MQNDFTAVLQHTANKLFKRLDDIIEGMIRIEMITFDVIDKEERGFMEEMCFIGFIDFADEELRMGIKERGL